MKMKPKKAKKYIFGQKIHFLGKKNNIINKKSSFWTKKHTKGSCSIKKIINLF